MRFATNWQKIADYELCIFDGTLQRPRFLDPLCFSGDRFDIAIYTDACAMFPPENDFTENVPMEAVYGGILAISGNV